jgi:hypothetical protein
VPVLERVNQKRVAWVMRTELVEDALKAADAVRGGLAGAIFYSDRGNHSNSKDFATLCTELGAAQSIGAAGTSAITRSRIVQRGSQTRSPARQELLGRRCGLPPCGVPIADPLHHETTTLHCRYVSPIDYEMNQTPATLARSRITTNPVPATRSQGPGTFSDVIEAAVDSIRGKVESIV